MKKLINGICLGFVLLLSLNSCKKKEIPDVEFAAEMRKFIINLSFHARATNPNFIIIPQNGAKLMSIDEENSAIPDLDYLAAIDGQGQEDLFFGYDKDDKASDLAFQNELIPFLKLGQNNGIKILVTDYCSSSDNIANSKTNNEKKDYISFRAPDRNLTVIPETDVFYDNENDILTLSDAKNFLYLINPNNYEIRDDFISALNATNYDAFIIDLFDFHSNPLAKSDIEILQTKPNGAKRLVIAYMSIGEAEDYRYYWDPKWKKRKNEPEWLYAENKDWKGNFKVFYWMPDWQKIIFGNQDSYLDRIIDTGFDGVYLDIVDAYEFFDEEKNK
ncbi:MAG: endo alpha-1,4 polygalactosaminidase [Crocinitomicaceae bacterium]